MDILDLLESDVQRPPQLVHGILHQGSKLVIGGGSKSYKTWSLLDLAVSVAAGVPWWGFETEKGRVAYINFEIQNSFFQRRMFDILEAKNCTVDRGQFLYWGLRGYAAEFGGLLPEVVDKTKDQKLALIVIDPIYKGLGDRDENKAGDIAGLLNQIERLAVDTGAAVAFGHHFSKGNQAGKEAMDRIGGSGVFARDPDTILTMTKHEEENAFTVEAILRNFAPIDSFVVQRQHPLMVRNDELNPAALKQAGPTKEKYSDEDILESLDGDGMTTTDWQCDVVRRLKMSPSNFMIRRRQLADAGLVRQEGKEWLRVAKAAVRTSFVRPAK
jgi:RecA-family ATPase